MTGEYVEIGKNEVPPQTRFDVTARNQGQIVEVAYGDLPQGQGENGPGDPYRRVTNQSIARGKPGRVRYFRRAKK